MRDVSLPGVNNIKRRTLIAAAVLVALFFGVHIVMWVRGNRLGNRASQAMNQFSFMSSDMRWELCRSISESAFVTGLFFNPSGTQTFFSRSLCFQKLAALEQNEALCDEVRERPSMFLNGSKISKWRCVE